ncbi:RPOL4c domain-containing protein [Mycena indigotica]|uniref:DNA-directed RNA polymerase III subunit RPC9 n=1 Tax=Mycena indigotica TaxID=2126181 RepID=A0A8H6TG92_9AGAR|nr:RPOL4c domain-containing protein [Mycena indigotica]KAF7316121.1 RPOL4c domain-containing protein [Mycena indigotica]
MARHAQKWRDAPALNSGDEVNKASQSMEARVINPRSALLSNYEVLSLLQELEADHLARTKIAHRIKKEEEAAGTDVSVPIGGGRPSTAVETLENLRTVSFEAIKYLSADHQSTTSQTPEAVTELVKSLESYGFTKAEKLQIVNLAPQEQIELYVIVEELEDRLSQEQMVEVAEHVKKSLAAAPSLSIVAQPSHKPLIVKADENWDATDDVDEEFDDQGEGAGVEGDLDMEED